jgi:hypothetical protein
MNREVTVGPDPHFQITEADRTAHHAAVMSAHALQEQLAAARDAAQALSLQLEPIRQYFTTEGESGKGPLQVLEKVTPGVVRLQGDIARALQAAGRAESTIDAYPGLPTAAQARDLDWAWEDATNSVTALNLVLGEEMAGVYAALAPGSAWKPIPPVPVPVRTK